MNQYIELLKSTPLLRRLSTIQLIAYFGAWFSNVAIYTLLLEMKVGADVVAFVAMLHFLAGIIQAPVSGAIADKIKPKKLLLLLIATEALATLALLMVQGAHELNLLYVLIFAKMAAASFYFTVEMSILPKILDSAKLQKANELHSIIWSFSYTLGMALSGFVVYAFGITMAFLLDALLFLISFYLLYTVEFSISIERNSASLGRMMHQTIGYIKNSKKALHLMVLHAFVGLTAFDALVALMVDRYYAAVIATSLGLGLLHASRAIGLVVGPMILGKWVNNQRFVTLFFFQATALLLWAMVMKNIYLSIAASVVVGLFTTTLWSYTYTLLQTNIDEEYYGRVIAYNDMLFLSVASFTSYGIGFLATRAVSLEGITILLGAGFAVGGVYAAWILKKFKLKD